MGCVVKVVDTKTSEVGEGHSTRETILMAATACFAEKGYEGTSLNDIAAEVGIRRPSLLHHFPSKEALYGEVFERLLSDWLSRLEVAIAANGRGWEKVEVVLDAAFVFLADNPSYVRLMRREAIDAGTHVGIDLPAVLRPYFTAAANYLQRQMDDGTFRVHDAEQLLLTGYGAILSYFSDATFIGGLLGADPLSAERLRRRRQHITVFFRAALVPEGI
jgi:TetR/AcrR family transcriptional regulator